MTARSNYPPKPDDAERTPPSLKHASNWPTISALTVNEAAARVAALSPAAAGRLVVEAGAQFGVDPVTSARFFDRRTIKDLVHVWNPRRSSPQVTALDLGQALRLLARDGDGPAPLESAVPAEAPSPDHDRRLEQLQTALFKIRFEWLKASALNADRSAWWLHSEPPWYAPRYASHNRLRMGDGPAERVGDWLERRLKLNGQPRKGLSAADGARARAVHLFVSGLISDADQALRDLETSRRTWRALALEPATSPRVADFIHSLDAQIDRLLDAGARPPGPRFDGMSSLRIAQGTPFVYYQASVPMVCNQAASCDSATFDLAATDPTTILQTPCPLPLRPDSPPDGCGSRLAAIVGILGLIAEGGDDSNRIRHLLNAEPWEFALDALHGATTGADEAANPVAGAELGWCVTPEKHPYLAWFRPKKRGDGWVYKAHPRTSPSVEHYVRDPETLVLHQTYTSTGTNSVGLTRWMGEVLALRRQPRVFWRDGNTVYPLRILSGQPELVMERADDQGGLRPTVSFLGRPLDIEDFLSPRSEMPGPGSLFYRTVPPEPGADTGQVEIGTWTEAALRACRLAINAVVHRRRTGVDAPPLPAQSHARVAEALLKLRETAPVRLDRAWLGDCLEAPLRLLLRLAFGHGPEGRQLELSVRVHYADDVGALLPGDGLELVPVRLEGTIAHYARDFDAELQLARTLVERVASPAQRETLDPNVWSITEGELDAALDLLKRLEALQADGFEDLPVTVEWSTERPSLSRQMQPTDIRIRIGGKKRRDWLQVEGGVNIDGSELPLSELLEALRDQKRFIALKGDRFVEVDAELKRQLAPLQALARKGKGGDTAHPLSLPLVDSLRNEGVEVDIPPDWQLRSDKLHAAMRAEPEVPATLQAELRAYQREGFAWLQRLSLWSTGGVLADDMGLGKTVQAIAFLLSRDPGTKHLIVAPTSVVPNWRRELDRFAPSLKVQMIQAGAQADPEDIAGRADLIITSYDVLVRNAEAFQSRPWDTLVLDEAHAIKNSQTRRAKVTRDLEASFVLALTGTPVENRPRELWSLFRVVAPGLLGGEDDFQEVYGRPIEDRRDAGAAAALAALVRPFVLRRTKGQVATDLPDRDDIRVDVVFGQEERARYDKIRKAAVATLSKAGAKGGKKGNALQIFAVITRLRQLACHGHLVEPRKVPRTRKASAKLDRLVELVSELVSEERRTLIFSQFTEFLDIIAEAFAAEGLPFIQLDGSTPAKKRTELIDRFQSGEVPLFLLSLKAGGVGLNLTAASEVILLDPWWNPAVEDQATDRAHRIGQDKGVTVYRFIAEGTIEEQIVAMHGDKRAMVSSLLDGTAGTASLGLEEIERLLLGDLNP